jgi:hypothetical protein
VKNVVAAKKPLIDEGGKELVFKDAVYIRTLLSNNTPSTAMPRWNDWSAIVERCFDNREADIGNFLRRHLGGLSGREIVSKVASSVVDKDVVIQFLEDSLSRYDEVIVERKLDLPKHGSWSCYMVINGKVPKHRANKNFLRALDSYNPSYTGWPVWLNSENFSDKTSHPYKYKEIWEAMIVSIDVNMGHIDFLRFAPEGHFFIRRALQDDTCKTNKQVKSFTQLEFGLSILRTAEVIAVGLAFAKAMECPPEKSTLSFVFNWTGLKGRKLSSWANPSRSIWSGQEAYQDTVQVPIEVPMDIPSSHISDYVKMVIDLLFEIFEYKVSQVIVDELTNSLLNRQL